MRSVLSVASSSPPVIDDDGPLVAKAQRGDEHAFGELVTRYRTRMYQLAYGMVNHHETAMDLTQEGFLRAYQHLAAFRGEAKFSTWLRRIVTNACLDYVRKAEHRAATASYDETRAEDEDPDGVSLAGALDPPDSGVTRWELGRAILEAMRELTPEQRAAIVLREVEEMSYEEIAKTMDCAVGTVMSRLHYARKRLQSLLREHHER
ncbi:MAG: sigma-70 family RNA polymerase sigma factor [Nitrospirota bacterium]